MRLPTLAGVERALAELAPHHRETPLERSELLSRALDADVWLKNETVSPIGCFKLRGALVDVLRAMQSRSITKLVTSSSGNHGQGVAYAGRLVNLPVTVFLPKGASPVKAAMISALGAEIRVAGDDSLGTKAEASAFASENNSHFVDDGGSLDLSEGAGTVGLEIARRLDDIDAALIPVGDAALINGSASALKAIQHSVRVIGVQAAGASALAESRQIGHRVEKAPHTMADGLATRSPADLALAGMMALVDEFVLVQELDLLRAIHTLAVMGHMLAEPSAAAGLAAAWNTRDRWHGRRIVIVITGANTTSEILKSAFAAPALFHLPTSGN
jgi:threonine dehydratase